MIWYDMIQYTHTHIHRHTLHYITLHCITLHYMHCITLHYIALHYIALHYITYIHTHLPMSIYMFYIYICISFIHEIIWIILMWKIQCKPSPISPEMGCINQPQMVSLWQWSVGLPRYYLYFVKKLRIGPPRTSQNWFKWNLQDPIFGVKNHAFL